MINIVTVGVNRVTLLIPGADSTLLHGLDSPEAFRLVGQVKLSYSCQHAGMAPSFFWLFFAYCTVGHVFLESTLQKRDMYLEYFRILKHTYKIRVQSCIWCTKFD
jgi:hypothetical protein